MKEERWTITITMVFAAALVAMELTVWRCGYFPLAIKKKDYSYRLGNKLNTRPLGTTIRHRDPGHHAMCWGPELDL